MVEQVPWSGAGLWGLAVTADARDALAPSWHLVRSPQRPHELGVLTASLSPSRKSLRRYPEAQSEGSPGVEVLGPLVG